MTHGAGWLGETAEWDGLAAGGDVIQERGLWDHALASTVPSPWTFFRRIFPAVMVGEAGRE